MLKVILQDDFKLRCLRPEILFDLNFLKKLKNFDVEESWTFIKESEFINKVLELTL